MNALRFAALLAWQSLTVIGLWAAEPAKSPMPLLPSAHSHNDYERRRPLWDALDSGVCSVEADIYLIGGQLLVAHERAATSQDRTLENMYLAPLQKRVREHRGNVYDRPVEFSLLVDIKSEPDAVYPVLKKVLMRYRSMLTEFSGTHIRRGAITVVLSGERPIQQVSAEKRRWWALDGRLPDLDTNPPASLYPWVSSSWLPTFSWRGEGEIPAAEAEKLKAFVDRAHAQGRRIRFWGTGDNPKGWAVLQTAGVDILNADDLPKLRAFLLRQP